MTSHEKDILKQVEAYIKQHMGLSPFLHETELGIACGYFDESGRAKVEFVFKPEKFTLTSVTDD